MISAPFKSQPRRHNRRQRRRRRTVITGNPSLETHQGFVHTYRDCDDGSDDDDIIDRSNRNSLGCGEDCSRMVAICGVPPEQVPEGVLNLARSYRTFIKHVRVLITPSTDTTNNPDCDGEPDASMSESDRSYSIEQDEDGEKDGKGADPNARDNSTRTFAEDAASILAEEQEHEYRTNQSSSLHQSTDYDDESNSSSNDDEFGSFKNHQSGTNYMVLMLLESSQVAKSIVQNLHGKPFNNFEKDVVASVYHVSKLEGEVSLSLSMNPCIGDGGDGDGDERERRPRSLSSSTHSGRNRSSSVATASAAASSPLGKGRAYTATRSTTAEVNNCPVCLDPMELDIPEAPSVFTTVCNHTFHLNCLLQWEDAPCPVCRFDHAGINDTLSQCHKCGSSTGKIYVCLICGVASCSNHHNPSFIASADGGGDADGGAATAKCIPIDTTVAFGIRGGSSKDLSSSSSKIDHCGSHDTISAVGGHAREHYDETLHAYAVDTETQHVWDFVGQGYVHRLIQNAGDGKIVEVADPSNTTSQERSLIPSLTDAEEGEVVHRKLEGYASEYHNLLQNQLGQQRLYFEGVLEQIRHDHEMNANKSKETAQSPSALISALKQELNQLQQRHRTLEKKSNKVAENITFLKNMNESLEANKEPMEREIQELEKARIDYGEMLKRHLPVLEERVRLLMIKLENP